MTKLKEIREELDELKTKKEHLIAARGELIMAGCGHEKPALLIVGRIMEINRRLCELMKTRLQLKKEEPNHA